MPVTLRDLAERFGGTLRGAPDVRIERVATLANATPGAITFLANRAYLPQLRTTQAAAVILDEKHVGESPVPCLVTKNPYAVYARVAAALHPPRAPVPGVHPSAVVEAGATVEAGAEVGPQAVVESGSRIGAGAVIGPGCSIGRDVQIGEGTRLAARVTVQRGVRIGARCIVHPGAVIGSDGFGFAEDFRDSGGWVKVPQLGGVLIGDDVEIGANTTIDRGAIEDTVIESGVKIDNLVQIAHNVHVGAHTAMAARTGIAGSTKIGRRCMIAGGVGIIGHLSICDDVVLLVRSLVTHSITEPGVYGGTLPAEEASRWRRNAARFRQLDELARRVRELERGER